MKRDCARREKNSSGALLRRDDIVNSARMQGIVHPAEAEEEGGKAICLHPSGKTNTAYVPKKKNVLRNLKKTKIFSRGFTFTLHSVKLSVGELPGAGTGEGGITNGEASGTGRRGFAL